MSGKPKFKHGDAVRDVSTSDVGKVRFIFTSNVTEPTYGVRFGDYVISKLAESRLRPA